MHLNLCYEITSVYSTKTFILHIFPHCISAVGINNVIVTAFLISFILSGDTYACFLLPINKYCLDTHDIISTFKFDYQQLTTTVRGSDYSPAIELSEQKDKLVTATGDTEKYSEKQANKVWLNSVYWFSRY